MGLFSKLFKGPQPDMEKSAANEKKAVSYTHLDVYKRQLECRALMEQLLQITNAEKEEFYD